MATKSPVNENIGTAASILSLLQGLTGSKGTTETTTTGRNLDPSLMMTQLLEAAGTHGYGKQGLAGTLTAGKRAGVYGGKSTQLNLNDLLARVSAEATIASAPQVTTRTGIGAKKGMVSPLAAGALGLAGIASSKKLREKMGINEVWDEFFGAGTPDALITNAPGAVSDFYAMDAIVDPSLAMDISSVPDFVENALVTPEELGAFQNIDSSFAPTSAEGFSGVADLADIGTEFFGGWAENGTAIAADGSDLAFNIGLDAAGDAASGGIPYLGAAMNLAEGDVGGAILSGAGFALGGPIGGFVGGLVDSLIGGDDCYITTATTRNQYKPDDCHELQMMRKFRDEFGKLRYPAEVADYYETAPAIVAAIRAREDAREILDTLYTRYIVPAVKYAEQEKYEEAYEVYSAMVKEAKKYLLVEA